ncbi:protein of unknown function [Vibrio tapetis subsp. tapetis]|uniref:Uncharacterized protein n=1 Tax=Vibrio tapetis subsp. tapetis TaxID=1671868 RepID=A0A2N8Z8N6_9VIBR|nr:protein of unknown function [Vibrio tapetis subsp. tapetis]
MDNLVNSRLDMSDGRAKAMLTEQITKIRYEVILVNQMQPVDYLVLV